MITESVSHYRVLRKLGAGGMGEVFLAEDLKLGRKVAIKFLIEKGAEDDQARRRLIREAKAAAALDHPNICAIHEVNDEGAKPFIVMQYVEGENLATKIKTHPLDFGEIIEIAEQLTGALAEAHSLGIIHRDIKPQNVFVTSRGQVKVLDFGVAKVIPDREGVHTESDTLSQLTETGKIVGTVGYMSPEQLKGEPVDARTDLFSLGVVLYNCATGKSAFTGSSTLEICLKVIQSEPPKPSDINPVIPPELERVILKAMAKDVDARYQSAAEMLSDIIKLKAALPDQSQIQTRIIPQGLASLPFKISASLSDNLRRKPLKVALLIAPVLLALAAWLVFPFLRGPLHQPSPEAKGWFDMGTNAIREGAYYQATKTLTHAIELDNEYALAHARLAEAYMEIDSIDRAANEIAKALSLVPDRTALPKLDALYLNAIAATVTRKYSEAIEHYRKIVEQAPETEKSSAFMDLGRAYEKNENIDKAIESYQESARLASASAGAFLRLAILYGRKQDFKNANEAFDKAENIYKVLSNQEGTAEVYFQRGTMFSKINKFQDARHQLEKALSIASQPDIDNKYQQIRAKLQLSRVYLEENSDHAKRVATEAIKMAQDNNLRNLAVNGLIDFGYTFVHRGEYDEAGKYFKKALEFAIADDESKSEARALLALGLLNVQVANDDEGIQQLNKALKFYEPSGYRKETSIALTMLGRAQRNKGYYEEAIKIFKQQMDLSKELGDSAMVADANLSLALTLGSEQDRYAEALPYIEESYKINQSLGISINAGFDEMNRAGMLWQLGRYDEAHTSLNNALSIATRRETGNKALHAWVHMTYGQIALSKRNLAEAGKRAQRAMELAGTEYRDLTVQAKCTIGMTLALSGETRPAIKVCEEALSIAKETKSLLSVSNALLALSQVMIIANDAKGALEAALQAQEMFARASRLDSEWRAWLVAARASRMEGNKSQASDYASRAYNLLSALQQKWDEQTFEGYAKRPDIQSYRNQLIQILTMNK